MDQKKKKTMLPASPDPSQVSKEWYRDFLEEINDLAYILDKNLNIIYANGVVEEMAGIKREEIMGKTILPLFREEDLPRLLAIIDRLRLGHSVEDIFAFRKSGVIAHFKTKPLSDKNGRFNGALGIARDITEKLKLEEKLRNYADNLEHLVAERTKELKESEERYRELFENANDAIFVLDLKGNIIGWNKWAEEISGFSKEEILGKFMGILLSEEGIRWSLGTIQRLLQGEKIEPYEQIIQTKKGPRIVEISSTALKAQGQVVGIQGIARNVTDKKQLEEKIMQSEKLKALGEMAGGVAHDFNNMLAAILGRAQLLEQIVSDPTQKKWLKIIEQAALDGAETVRRIQEFTKVAPGRDFVTVDVNKIVKDVLMVTEPKWKDQAQEKGINVVIETQLGQVLPVAGNPSELREVLTNMVFNALDAMPEGGKIRFTTWADANSVFISVNDTGIGMGDEIRKKVFDPFFTTKGPQGSGLGMSVSYGIVKRHNGDIHIETEKGKGSTFVLILPAQTCSKEEEKKEKTTTPGNKKGKILIVEDEELVQENLRDILSFAGHQVSVAANGRDGILMAEREAYDLVFTDLGMPGISGWEVAKAIKGINPEITVVLVTGWGAQLDHKKIQDSGIDTIQTKPFEISEILDLVNKTINSKGAA